MKRSWLIMTLFYLFFTQFPLHAEENLWDVDNVAMCRISDQPDLILVAINDPVRGVIWGIIRFGSLFLPPIELKQSDWAICSLSVSPDLKYLAVVGVSEGHTWLYVYLLSDILDLKYDGPEQVVEPISEYNGYPDNVFFNSWDGHKVVLRVDEGGSRSSTAIFDPETGMIMK